MKGLVTVIILNYNGKDFLKTCIASVKKQTYRNIEILVADNNSSDGSVEYVKTLKGVEILKLKDNFGYAKTNNLAAIKAKGEFVLFLNNDTKLFPDFVNLLVANHKVNSISAPTQIRSWDDNDRGFAGFGMDLFGYPFAKEYPEKYKVFFADGSAIFMRKKDFISIGMFDEELFIFQEDIDLAWRAQIMGYAVIPNLDAKYLHYGGATVPGRRTEKKKYVSSYFRRYLNEKNVIRNMMKNYSLLFLTVLLPILVLIHVIESTVLLILGKYKAAQCYFDAYRWNILNFKNTLKFRKKVQSNRKVSDFEIMKRIHFNYSKLYAFIKLGMPEFQ